LRATLRKNDTGQKTSLSLFLIFQHHLFFAAAQTRLFFFISNSSAFTFEVGVEYFSCNQRIFSFLKVILGSTVNKSDFCVFLTWNCCIDSICGKKAKAARLGYAAFLVDCRRYGVTII
jgi:hypothetical protein